MNFQSRLLWLALAAILVLARIGAGLYVWLSPAVGAEIPLERWREFTPEEGGFTCRLPDKPHRLKGYEQTPVERRYGLMRLGRGIDNQIVVVESPKKRATAEEFRRMAEGERDAALVNAGPGMTLDASTTVAVPGLGDGYDFRFSVKSEKRVGVLRVVMRPHGEGARYFSLIVVAPPRSPAIDAFLDNVVAAH